MKILNLLIVTYLATLLVPGTATAATYTATTPACDEIIDINPDADLCFGTTEENANAQQVLLNSDTFVDGASSVTGLFGYTDWTSFISVDTVPGDQKTGTFLVGDNNYGMVAVLLKSSNTFAAYLFESGFEGELEFFTANDKGLSNYVVAGRMPSPIPLPAGGILLITALGGLGFAARRRRKSS